MNDVQQTSQLSTAESRCHALARETSECDPKTFRGRLLARLLERASAEVRKEKEDTDEMVQSRRLRMIEQGVVDEIEANEYIQHPYDPLPPHIQERRMAIIARDNEKEREAMRAQQVHDAKRVYNDTWLLQKEREMFHLVEKVQSTKGNAEMTATLQSMLEITENKIKLYHERQGTMHNIALEERERVCHHVLGLIPDKLLPEVKRYTITYP